MVRLVTFRFIALTVLFSAVLTTPGCGPKAEVPVTEAAPIDTLAVLKEAYVFGLPLMLMDLTRQQLVHPQSPMYAPANQFKHNNFFPDANFRSVVRPNVDTYYSTAFLDLGNGPLVLEVPDTKGRYYMLPMLDAYTNVFAAPGTRTTGNGAKNFVISGPGWTGSVPEGMEHILAPTPMVWIIGRTQVNSKADGQQVVPLQKQLVLRPLSPDQPAVAPPQTPPSASDPNSTVRNMDLEIYFNKLNELLAANPPAAADSAVVRRMSALGIGAGLRFSTEGFSPTAQAGVRQMPEALFKAFEEGKAMGANSVNGWSLGNPKTGKFGTDYLGRAGIAVFGLGANLFEDAVYPVCGVDQNGEPLVGSQRYVIRFEEGQTPPVQAFWSLTLYDSEGYFVPNPMNRYALGDRSGLKKSADGSIEIYLQKDSPGKDKESNWLPCPEGSFNLLMRLYWPKPEVVEGKYAPPAIVKVS